MRVVYHFLCALLGVLLSAQAGAPTNAAREEVIGFAFSGAGGRIAQHFAMAQALIEGSTPDGKRVIPQFLAGASSGAISCVTVSAILQTMKGEAPPGREFTFAMARELLFTFSTSVVYNQSIQAEIEIFTHNIPNGYVLDSSPLAEFIGEWCKRMGLEKLGDLSVPTCLSVVSQRSGKTERLCSDDPASKNLSLPEVLMASTAIPLAFAPRNITGLSGPQRSSFIDGGTGIDTLPIVPVLARNVTKAYMLCYASAFDSGAYDELPAIAKKVTLLANGLVALAISRVELFVAALDIAVNAPTPTYLYIPKLPTAYGVLDFDHEEQQFLQTQAWTDKNGPVLVDRNSPQVLALRQSTTAWRSWLEEARYGGVRASNSMSLYPTPYRLTLLLLVEKFLTEPDLSPKKRARLGQFLLRHVDQITGARANTAGSSDPPLSVLLDQLDAFVVESASISDELQIVLSLLALRSVDALVDVFLNFEPEDDTMYGERSAFRLGDDGVLDEEESLVGGTSGVALIGQFARRVFLGYDMLSFAGVCELFRRVRAYVRQYEDAVMQGKARGAGEAVGGAAAASDFNARFRAAIAGRQLEQALAEVHRHFDLYGGGAPRGEAAAGVDGHGDVVGVDANPRLLPVASLHIAVAHFEFGEVDEGMRALNECVSSAHEQGDEATLAIALSWILRASRSTVHEGERSGVPLLPLPDREMLERCLARFVKAGVREHAVLTAVDLMSYFECALQPPREVPGRPVTKDDGRTLPRLQWELSVWAQAVANNGGTATDDALSARVDLAKAQMWHLLGTAHLTRQFESFATCGGAGERPRAELARAQRSALAGQYARAAEALRATAEDGAPDLSGERVLGACIVGAQVAVRRDHAHVARTMHSVASAIIEHSCTATPADRVLLLCLEADVLCCERSVPQALETLERAAALVEASDEALGYLRAVVLAQQARVALEHADDAHSARRYVRSAAKLAAQYNRHHLLCELHLTRAAVELARPGGGERAARLLFAAQPVILQAGHVESCGKLHGLLMQALADRYGEAGSQHGRPVPAAAQRRLEAYARDAISALNGGEAVREAAHWRAAAERAGVADGNELAAVVTVPAPPDADWLYEGVSLEQVVAYLALQRST